MIERLRNAWLALMTPVEDEEIKEEDKCPKCGGEKLIDVTTLDMPVDRQEMLCAECNYTWQRDSTSE